jgi:hypothetical protein
MALLLVDYLAQRVALVLLHPLPPFSPLTLFMRYATAAQTQFQFTAANSDNGHFVTHLSVIHALSSLHADKRRLLQVQRALWGSTVRNYASHHNTKWTSEQVLSALTNFRKAAISLVMLVFPHGNNSAPTPFIFMKFDI